MTELLNLWDELLLDDGFGRLVVKNFKFVISNVKFEMINLKFNAR